MKYVENSWLQMNIHGGVSMVKLSIFADEISTDLTEQLDVMEAQGIRHMELRSVWKTGSLSLSDEQKATIKAELDKRGMKVVSIATGLGKYTITDDFEPQLRDCRIAVESAKFFGCDYIRVFSYWLRDQEETAILQHRDEVMRRMKALAEVAESAGVFLGHENEKGIFGEKPAECRDILDTVASPNLKAIFDPANFVQAGVRPYEEAWPLLKKDILYFHIKDAMLETGQVTPAGEGDGGVKEILREKLVDEGWEGVLSLEPHLRVPGPDGEHSGALAAAKAADALKRVLDELGVAYE